MSRSGILAGDSPPAGVVLAVRPEGWVVWWARLLVVSVSLCGLLVNTGCQPTSDMVMRKEYDDYKANQKTVKDEHDEAIAQLRSDLGALRKTLGDTDTMIQGNLVAESAAREADVRGASERIDTVEQTIGLKDKEFKQEIARYGDLNTQQLRLEERFDQVSQDIQGKVADVNTRVAEFSEEFSTDVAELHTDYNSLLITLGEHYQDLSRQLEQGQRGVRMQIEDFGKQIEDFANLAQSMAERSRDLVREASDIIDKIGEQTSTFTTDLEARTKEQEAEQEAPTEQP